MSVTGKIMVLIFKKKISNNWQGHSTVSLETSLSVKSAHFVGANRQTELIFNQNSSLAIG